VQVTFLSLSQTTNVEVAAAFEAYESAMTSGVRTQRLDARIQLCLVLQAHGWVAPQVVQSQIDRDLHELRAAASEAV
jgi:hypothetical protein